MRNNVMGLALWVLASLAAGGIGSRFMPGQWYASLLKPAWTPPSAVFAPVWTALYLLMGVAAWLVWRRLGFSGAAWSLSLFIVQLGLNACWSYLFFGAHRPLYALLDIVLLWLVILVTLVRFWKIVPASGALMLPYLLWVTFASALNFQLWRLNA